MRLHGLAQDGTRTHWRRWFAPLVVLAALATDYGSPAAMWTAAIPLLFMAVLLTFRERTAALAVLFLSSWVAIPAAAGALRAVDSARGIQRLVVVGDAPSLNCDGAVRVSRIEIDGDGPAVALRTAVAQSFAQMHNTLGLWSTESVPCGLLLAE